MDKEQLTVLIAAAAVETRCALRESLSSDAMVRYSIIEAETGASALELQRTRKPDCLILDEGLPDLSAVEAMRQLPSEGGSPACAVVVLVGGGETQLAVEVMKNGAHDCLVKDRFHRFQGEELRCAVRYAIEKAGRRQQRTRSRAAAASLSEIAGNKQASTQRGERVALAVDREFRSLFDASAIGTTQTSPDGKYLRVNHRICQMLGYSAEDLLRLTLHDVTHPDDRVVSAALFSSSFSGKPEEYTIEKRFVRKDGSIIWGLINWEVICDAEGQPLHAIANIQDITARKHAEEALSASEAQLRAILDNSTAVIFIKDLEGRYLRINRWYEVVRGLSEAEVKGQTDYDLYDKEIAEAVRANDREVVAANKPLHFEEQVTLRDGLRHFISIKFPLYDDHGRPYAVCGIATDITDRKRAEAEREELLTRAHAAREAAEAANRSKDEFLAVVSHELRSPLNAMLGYAHLLRYGPLDAQKVKHAVDVIERNGRAQSQLIDDLLDTARIISGKLRLDIVPLDLVDVIEEAVQTIYPAADAKGLSLQIDTSLKAVQITGDPARLRQVVWNLLSNAVKFTPAGGRVDVRLERIDPHVCITVGDTGRGINADFMPYVFDRFRQADTSNARRYGGLGLGLSLVKYLVELHGGTIEAASEGKDKGSTFKVMLPVRAVFSALSEAGAAPAAGAAPEKAATLKGVRVLIVDDENDARELIKTALEWHGAEVIAASAAAEAYALVTAATSAEERPAVIVADLEMPEEDGYSLRRRLRSWENAHGFYIPAVALTAYARTEDRILAMRAGFQIHIAKPVDPVELAAVIASLAKQPKT